MKLLSPLVLDVNFRVPAEFSVSNTHIINGHELTCTVEAEYDQAFEVVRLQ